MYTFCLRSWIVPVTLGYSRAIEWSTPVDRRICMWIFTFSSIAGFICHYTSYITQCLSVESALTLKTRCLKRGPSIDNDSLLLYFKVTPS